MNSGTARSRFAHFIVDAFSSESTVYGIVLVSALIAVGWEFSSNLEILVFIVVTTLVFWITHVYSRAAVAHDEHGNPLATGAAVREALGHSSGMLLGMLVPAILLLLAVVHVLDEYVAYYVALWTGVALLVFVGYIVGLRNGRPLWRRLVSALVTGILGLIVIGLGVLAH